MRAMWAAALLLRRLRAEAGVALLLFVLVASTSFLFAAAPRLFNRVSDAAVRYAVAAAAPAARDVWLSATGYIGPGNAGAVSGVREYGQLREAEFPPSIEQLVSARALAFTTFRFAVPQSPVRVSLRYQDGVTDAAPLVAGRWPVDLGMDLEQTHLGDQADPRVPPTAFEAALSSDVARALQVQVGDRLDVALDLSDPLLPNASGSAPGGSGAVGPGTTVFGIAPTQIEVVGVFQPLDANAETWSGNGFLEPGYQYGAAGLEAIYATAYVPAEAYASLYAAHLPFRYDWRFQVDPARFDADQADALQLDLPRLATLSAPDDHRLLPDSKAVAGLANVTIQTGLAAILDRVAVQRAQSESVLSIAALGPLGLAAGATAMLAVLLIRRRRSSLLLARGRGASGMLLLGAQLWEAILLAGTAALVGFLLAVLAIPARDAPLSAILALAVAGVSTLLLVASTWPAARRPLIQLERDDPPILRVPPRRLVLEGTVAGIAVAAIFLLRQRGLTIGAVGETVRFDPLLAAVPLLSGLAAGILAVRLYPLPIRALGWLAARRRDLVPVVGLRTVARRPTTANLPLLVLLLTAAFGTFASVIASTIDRGQVATSYVQVGADYRLDQIGIGRLAPTVDPSTVPGIEAFAAGVVDPSAGFIVGSYQRSTLDLDTVDALAYETVTAGTAADPAWPGDFLAPPPGAGAGSATNPIPAMVSTPFLPGIANLGPGDTFTLRVAQQPLLFRLVQPQAGFPGHGDAGSFAIVPLDWMKAALPDASFAPTVMWLRGSAAAEAPLAAMVSGASEQVRITSRPDVYAALHDAPLGSAVADGFGLALAVAVLYLAITLVGAVIMSAAGRTRDLAYLRTLGVSTRQAVALTAMEHAPPVLLALVPGVLLGIGVALVVQPGLGLGVFVGTQDAPLIVDWLTLGIVIATLSLVVTVAIGAGTWLAGRASLASALRIEDS